MTIGYSAKKDKKAKRFSLESSVYFEEWKGKKIESAFPLKEKLLNKFKKK